VVNEGIAMKKELLTVLGCSSSLVLTLLTGTPANAESSSFPVREYFFTAPTSEPTENALEDCGCTMENAIEADFTEEEGDLAIERFGCDCAGCRYIVRSEKNTLD
jgi:hypothetical protein